MAEKKPVTFEKKMEQIQKLLDALQSEEIGLDGTISNYEAGIKLINECEGELAKFEQKVTEIKLKTKKD